MDNVTEIKVAVTAFFGAVSALLGWFGWLVVVFVCALAGDFATGSAVAAKEGNWSSSAAREGLWHKAGSILAVLLAGGADFMVRLVVANVPALSLPFDYTMLICPLVLVWYILTEFGSIIENIGALGAPLPKFLVRMIKSFGNAVDTAGDIFGGDDDKQ